VAARPVRIVRHRGSPAATPEAGPPGSRFVENRAGWVRARRLFLLFGLACAVLYATLLGEALIASPGLVTDSVALVVLTLAAVACFLAGAAVTIARAPRGVWWTGDAMVVRERFSAPRKFPKDVAWHVARRYGAGLLAPSPTEIVEVVPKTGRRTTYLVDEGLLKAAPP
jgi:hypothetical protein